MVRGRALQAGTDMGAFFIVNNLATWHSLVKAAWSTWSDMRHPEAMDTRPVPPPLDPVVNPTYEAWKDGDDLVK